MTLVSLTVGSNVLFQLDSLEFRLITVCSVQQPIQQPTLNITI